jgi:hypothetical protein
VVSNYQLECFVWLDGIQVKNETQLRLHHLSLNTTTVINCPEPGNMLQNIPVAAMLMSGLFVS